MEARTSQRPRLKAGVTFGMSDRMTEMELKTKENVIVLALLAGSAVLLKEESSSFTALKEALYPVCSLCNNSVHEMVE